MEDVEGKRFPQLYVAGFQQHRRVQRMESKMSTLNPYRLWRRCR